MKKMLVFLLSSFLLINLQAQKPKVIIDADTWNEIDDISSKEIAQIIYSFKLKENE